MNADRHAGHQRLRAISGSGNSHAIDDLKEVRCVAEHPSPRLVVVEQEVPEFVGQGESALRGIERAVEEHHANTPPGHKKPAHRALI